ncbi:MAG: molybdenum ABC transporter ATP-binding protein [Methylovirgula sp.]|uniref:molybdenum ABC transporter ATP-binding protein n=1 Tax=Methylovirgula sp. TaxID=1978224 RepID=UPI0030762BE3
MIDVDVARHVGTFNLKVAFHNDGGITALFGRSGSGKSLTIGLIAGLDRPDRGHVVLDGRALVDTDKRIFLPAYRRHIGMVFQDSHLFPHLGVRQNLLFGRWFAPRAARAISFDAVVEALGIGQLFGRTPAKLSGGERQRVAIGRALLSGPQLLLMDEPLAALDKARRLEILPLIERLRDEFKIPIVYVSHDIEEVSRLASRVVVLERGHVAAIGDPAEVLPTALGDDARADRASILTMHVGARDEAYGLTELIHPAGTIWLAGPHGAEGIRLRVVIKATDVTLSTAAPHGLSVQGALKGRLGEIETLGPLAIAHIALEGDGTLLAMTTRRALDELGLGAGAPVFALVKTAALDERLIGRA